jgi:hypothetical protein
MATVIPVDEFIRDKWYPGFEPGYTHAPWYFRGLEPAGHPVAEGVADRAATPLRQGITWCTLTMVGS